MGNCDLENLSEKVIFSAQLRQPALLHGNKISQCSRMVEFIFSKDLDDVILIPFQRQQRDKKDAITLSLFQLLETPGQNSGECKVQIRERDEYEDCYFFNEYLEVFEEQKLSKNSKVLLINTNIWNAKILQIINCSLFISDERKI